MMEMWWIIWSGSVQIVEGIELLSLQGAQMRERFCKGGRGVT